MTSHITDDVSISYFQPTLNGLFNNCIKLYWNQFLKYEEGQINHPRKNYFGNAQLYQGHLFHHGGPYHIETSPLICSTNHWSGYYIIGTSVMKELSKCWLRIKECWIQKQTSDVFCKRTCFSMFTGKHLRRRLFLIKWQVFRAVNLIKTDFNIGFFC